MRGKRGRAKRHLLFDLTPQAAEITVGSLKKTHDFVFHREPLAQTDQQKAQSKR